MIECFNGIPVKNRTALGTMLSLMYWPISKSDTNSALVSSSISDSFSSDTENKVKQYFTFIKYQIFKLLID